MGVDRQIAAVENLKQITCPYCDKNFGTYDAVVDHGIWFHPGKPVTADLLANGHNFIPRKNQNQQDPNFLVGCHLSDKVPEEKGRKRNVFLRQAKQATRTVECYKAFPFYSFLLVWGALRILHDIAVRAVCANAYGILPYLKQLAEAYCRSVQGGVVVLKRIEGDSILKLPYHTRFEEGYYVKIASQIKRLKKYREYHRGIFLTLTIDPKRYVNIHDAKESLNEEWNRLNTWFKKNPGLVRNWNGKFLRVVEFQPSMTKAIHLHVLLFGATWVDLEQLRPQWEKWMGEGTFLKAEILHQWYRDKKGVWRRSNAINYMLKYFWKSANDDDHKVLLWALGARAYSTSRSLLDDLIIFNQQKNNSNEKPTKKYQFVGIYPADLVKNITTYTELMSIGESEGG